LSCAELGEITFIIPRAQNSTAHHSAYFGKRALEAARAATFAEIPRFCKLIIVRVSSIMVG